MHTHLTVAVTYPTHRGTQAENLIASIHGGLIVVTGANGTSPRSASLHDAVRAYTGGDDFRYTINR